jgi:hypothetical protein
VTPCTRCSTRFALEAVQLDGPGEHAAALALPSCVVAPGVGLSAQPPGERDAAPGAAAADDRRVDVGVSPPLLRADGASACHAGAPAL